MTLFINCALCLTCLEHPLRTSTPQHLRISAQDASFKKYVEVYAKDKKKFFSDFAVAFQKLEELGTANLAAIA